MKRKPGATSRRAHDKPSFRMSSSSCPGCLHRCTACGLPHLHGLILGHRLKEFILLFWRPCHRRFKQLLLRVTTRFALLPLPTTALVLVDALLTPRLKHLRDARLDPWHQKTPLSTTSTISSLICGTEKPTVCSAMHSGKRSFGANWKTSTSSSELCGTGTSKKMCSMRSGMIWASTTSTTCGMGTSTETKTSSNTCGTGTSTTMCSTREVVRAASASPFLLGHHRRLSRSRCVPLLRHHLHQHLPVGTVVKGSWDSHGA